MIVDIHTHILPGIDDGAKDWDKSMEMLAASAKCGVKKIIATPHFLPWKQNTSPDEIRHLCREAEEKLANKLGISMDIYPGHEIYYSLEVIQNLKEGKILTLGGSKYVLIEFDPAVSYHTICRAMKDFREHGFCPIIAHAERYVCLRKSERISDVKRMGALLQINEESLQNGIFNETTRWVKQNLRKGEIDFIASDMHDMKRRSPLTEDKLQWVRNKLKPAYQKELLYSNAEKILNEIKA